MDVIERLKSGSIEQPLLSSTLARFRPNTELQFRAVTARLSPHSDIEIYGLMARIKSQLVGGRGISVIHTDKIVGITVHEFSPMSEVSVSYGHDSRLDAIAQHRSRRPNRSRPLRGHRQGIHTLEESSWRASVDSHPPLVDHLERRFVALTVKHAVCYGIFTHRC